MGPFQSRTQADKFHKLLLHKTASKCSWLFELHFLYDFCCKVIDGASARLWLRDGDRGWEHVVRVLAHTHHVLWEEYWPFLGIMFVGIHPGRVRNVSYCFDFFFSYRVQV